MQTAIIGGGIAGLVAANLLIDRGIDVTVYESSGTLGGRARSERHADCIVNLGPHAVYRAGAALGTLRRLGVDVSGGSPDLSAFDLVLDGEIVAAPATLWSTLTADYLTIGEKADIARFMSAVFLGDPSVWDETEFEAFARRFTDSRRVTAILRMAMTIGTYSASGRISAGAALRQIRRAFSNVIYPDDGWQRIVDQLAIRCRDEGVEIRLSAPVTNITDTTVKTRNGEQSFDAVVLAVPPDRVEKLANVDFGPRRQTRMASLDLVLEPDQALRNTFDLDTSVYLSVHSGVADLGDGLVVHVARYLDPFDERDTTENRAAIEALLDRVCPAWREQVRSERFLPSIPVNHWFPDAAGGGESGRPGVRLDERLWIAGDWVGDDGLLLDAAVASASRCARQIAAELDRTRALAS